MFPISAFVTRQTGGRLCTLLCSADAANTVSYGIMSFGSFPMSKACSIALMIFSVLGQDVHYEVDVLLCLDGDADPFSRTCQPQRCATP